MFNLSRTELVPSANGKVDAETIHILSMDVPNLCVLSVQIHEENVVRAYWYMKGSASRFYASDMVNIWPLYFAQQKDDDYKDQVANLIAENRDSIRLEDKNFDSFFETNTSISAKKAYL